MLHVRGRILGGDNVIKNLYMYDEMARNVWWPMCHAIHVISFTMKSNCYTDWFHTFSNECVHIRCSQSSFLNIRHHCKAIGVLLHQLVSRNTHIGFPINNYNSCTDQLFYMYHKTYNKLLKYKYVFFVHLRHLINKSCYNNYPWSDNTGTHMEQLFYS